jgi:hypothetical protein
MRLIKLAILSFIILFLVVTIISLFIPGSITISKATNIGADNKSVYTYIENLSEWRLWHPALKDIPQNEVEVLDSNKIKVRGTSINVVERKQEEIVTEMTTSNGRPIISGLKVIRHPQSDSSTLQWYMEFKLQWYPWEKFKSLFFENIYGVQMEQGLSNLKELSKGAVRQ